MLCNLNEVVNSVAITKILLASPVMDNIPVTFEDIFPPGSPRFNAWNQAPHAPFAAALQPGIALGNAPPLADVATIENGDSAPVAAAVAALAAAIEAQELHPPEVADYAPPAPAAAAANIPPPADDDDDPFAVLFATIGAQEVEGNAPPTTGAADDSRSLPGGTISTLSNLSAKDYNDIFQLDDTIDPFAQNSIHQPTTGKQALVHHMATASASSASDGRSNDSVSKSPSKKAKKMGKYAEV
jgi:hypothetical protein